MQNNKKNNIFYKKGAEAELKQVLIDGQIGLSKKRTSKLYRDKKLDYSIRSKRTRAETKLLKEAATIVNTPKIITVNEKDSEIIMEFITGRALKEVIEKKPLLCIQAGEKIRVLHDAGIIHGDLTTSNIIFAEKNDSELAHRIKDKGSLFFIDFGLGYFSNKIEDKAVDLVVFKKTFNATHSGLKEGWGKVIQGYAPSKEIIDRMVAIEKRARYH